MSSKLKAGTSTSGAVLEADTTGILEIQTGSTPTTAITVDTSQNVGIGTSSPVSKLNVNGGAVTLAETTAGLYNIDFQSRTASTNARIQYDQVSNTTGQLLFYTNGGSLTEQMRINADGALLINRTTQVYDERLAILGKTSSQCMTLRSPVTGAYDMCNMLNGNGQVGSIQTNGSGTSYNTSSDYRLKENIFPMVGALVKVLALKPVTYKWKIDNSDGEGFIAHELAEIVPDAVSGEKDAVETYKDEDGNEQTRIKPQGIDTSYLVATLTSAIQELNAKVDAQALEIQALKGVA